MAQHSSTQDATPGFAAYDRMAGAYARKNETGVWNAYFERPSMLSLLPEISGRQVLDLGSGPGALSAELLNRGALVTAVDGSTEMLNCARQRLGDRVQFMQLDLNEGLTGIANQAFDLVVSSLTVHYVSDLETLAREIHRVLKPGGLFVASTHHPIMDMKSSPTGNYFKKELIISKWQVEGERYRISYFRRSLSATLSPFNKLGFSMDALSEGIISDQLRQSFPEETLRFEKEPYFIFFRFRK